MTIEFMFRNELRLAEYEQAVPTQTISADFAK